MVDQSIIRAEQDRLSANIRKARDARGRFAPTSTLVASDLRIPMPTRSQREVDLAAIAAAAEDRFQRADWDEPNSVDVWRGKFEQPLATVIDGQASPIADEQLVEGNGWSQPVVDPRRWTFGPGAVLLMLALASWALWYAIFKLLQLVGWPG